VASRATLPSELYWVGTPLTTVVVAPDWMVVVFELRSTVTVVVVVPCKTVIICRSGSVVEAVSVTVAAPSTRMPQPVMHGGVEQLAVDESE